MLIVKRIPGETIHILPSPDLGPEIRVSGLFKDGGIEIHLLNSQRAHASIGIEASKTVPILREELQDNGKSEKN